MVVFQSAVQSNLRVDVEGVVLSRDTSARTTSIRIRTWLNRTTSGFVDASFTADTSLNGTPYGANTNQRYVGAFGAVLVAESFHTISHNAEGTATVTIGGYAQANNVVTFNQIAGGSWTLDPFAPLAPSSLSVSRVSDTQHTLSWTRNATYTSVVVQRQTNDGSWVEVGRPTSNPASFTDTSTVANRKYAYRVAGVTAGGQSAWSNTFTVYTTPAPPSAVSAERSGSNIVVSATGLPPYATSYNVEDNGASVATGVSLPWTHVSPNAAVTHTYRIRSVRGSLVSGLSTASNTVQLLTAPAAPTGLAPNGVLRASDAPVVFSWTHNPLDSSPQTAYELRHRPVGGAWTTLTGTTASTRSVTLGIGNFEWQVRTKGQHPNFSAWSAVGTVEVITRPGVAVNITDPYLTRTLVAAWTFSQAQSKPQSQWVAELYDTGMLLLESRSGTGTTGSVTFQYLLVDGESYTVKVRAATGGVWSDDGVQAFTASFVPPAEPVVSAGWDNSTGVVSVAVSPQAGGGSVPATVSVLVERSVDGLVWEPVFSGGPAVTLADGESLSAGVTEYRVSAFSSEGASSVVTVDVVADSGDVWLSGGVGFLETARLPYSPQVSVRAARERTTRRYKGRTLPVAYAGENANRVVSVSGLIPEGEAGAGVDQLANLAMNEEPVHLYRDPDGRRIYGALSDVQLPREQHRLWGYSFTLEETDR